MIGASVGAAGRRVEITGEEDGAGGLDGFVFCAVEHEGSCEATLAVGAVVEVGVEKGEAAEGGFELGGGAGAEGACVCEFLGGKRIALVRLVAFFGWRGEMTYGWFEWGFA